MTEEKEIQQEQKIDLPVEGKQPNVVDIHLAGIHRILAPQLMKIGCIMDPKTGKWVLGERAIRHDAPWIYTWMEPSRRCLLYQALWDAFKRRMAFVPKYCTTCWKVCVCNRRNADGNYVPLMVTDLFQLYEIQKKHFKPRQIPCKCGMDLRDYTPHRYGAYWYNHGKDQGVTRWYEVRKLVDEIKPDGDQIEVILKRGCTEYEMLLGPTDSARYERQPWADRVEAAAMESIEERSFIKGHQSAELRKDIRLRWIQYAWQIGDMSVLALNDGQPLYTPLVTYHGEYLKRHLEGKENGTQD